MLLHPPYLIMGIQTKKYEKRRKSDEVKDIFAPPPSVGGIGSKQQ